MNTHNNINNLKKTTTWKRNETRIIKKKQKQHQQVGNKLQKQAYKSNEKRGRGKKHVDREN